MFFVGIGKRDAFSENAAGAPDVWLEIVEFVFEEYFGAPVMERLGLGGDLSINLLSKHATRLQQIGDVAPFLIWFQLKFDILLFL